MGLLDKALGTATDAQASEVEELVGPILIQGESISHAFVVGMRDLFLITSKRFILLDKTGLTGKKMKISSYPWSKVASFSYCNSGKIDIDAELYINVQTLPTSILVRFPRKTDLRPIIKSISEHVL